MDIRYVDDPFGDDADPLDASKEGYLDLLRRLLATCGRERVRFKDTKERTVWRKLAKLYDKGRIDDGWIDNCVEWAEDKNRHRVVIQLISLMNLIMNLERLQEWQIKAKRR